MPPPAIQRLTSADAERYRRIRLHALREAPDAFGTTYAEDAARPLESWRAQLSKADAPTFVATDEGVDLGTAKGSAWDGEEGAAGLFGMWVAPDARERGVGRALVDAVVAWAREQGYRRVLLDVGEDSAPAIRLYAACGFEPTGATGSLPHPHEHVLEHERELRL